MRCKFFYDCEFLEGTQNKTLFGFRTPFKSNVPTIDLISIGMVSELGDEYYGISKEFNLKEAWNRQDPNGSFWLRENVLGVIYDRLTLINGDVMGAEPFSYSALKMLINKYGKTREDIAEDILMMVRNVQGKLNDYSDIQLFGYYSAYDHVALCWLFGKMIDLPKGFPMFTTDLKQIFDEINAKIPEHNLKSYQDYPKASNEHDALEDARWNWNFFKFLNNHK